MYVCVPADADQTAAIVLLGIVGVAVPLYLYEQARLSYERVRDLPFHSLGEPANRASPGFDFFVVLAPMPGLVSITCPRMHHTPTQ